MQTDFDFGELFTGSVRRLMPLVRERRLRLVFDYEGEPVVLRGEASQWEQALQRVFAAAVEVLHDGFVLLTAQVHRPGRGCRIAVAAALSGQFAPATVRRVLEQLQLQGVDQLSDEALLELKTPITGTCPLTGGRLQFISDAAEGALLSLMVQDPPLSGSGAAGGADDAQTPDAAAARAWLIGEEALTRRALERRLQRLGWATRCFGSTAEAEAGLRALAPRHARPALVIAEEGPAVTLDALRLVWHLLPPDTQVVLAVAPDSPTLQGAGRRLDLAIRVQPFSPGELRGFTQRAVSAQAPSGLTRPAPLGMAQRLRALVVDDNAVNQMVAAGMLQALGFEVDTADDGQAAIDHCLRRAPHLVLMDLHMPGMDGFEAARRLRLMQSEGSLPAFPILAATADVTAEAASTAAGMDAHLPKPINLQALEDYVRRLLPQMGC